MLKNVVISKEAKIAMWFFMAFFVCLSSLLLLPMTRESGKTICIEADDRLPLAETFRKRFLFGFGNLAEELHFEVVSDKIQYQKWRPWPMFLVEIRLNSAETSENLVVLSEKWRQSGLGYGVSVISEVSSPKYDETLQMYIVRAKLYQQFGSGKDAQLLLMAEGLFLQEIN